MTSIPRRVQAWGWFMNRFDSMHIATMSPADIAHNQTMKHVPAPIRRVLFGARDKRVTVEDRLIAVGAPTPVAASDAAAVAAASDAAAAAAPADADGDRQNSHTIAVRLYCPRIATPGGGTLPVALYLHGGGWTLFGALDMCDWLPSRVSAELGAIVIAVDYRLAPEHPFPAAVDDCYAALEWAAAEAAALGGDPGRLSVFGDSAGGNLAAVLALLSRDRGGPTIAAQGLIYPVTDTITDDASMRMNAESPVLRQTDMVRFLDLYLGPKASGDARTDARAAPIRASSHAGLPPAQIQVGAQDVLRDQGVRYAERLAAAGSPVELTVYSGAPHGWVTYPTIMSVSRRSVDDLVDFLRTNA